MSDSTEQAQTTEQAPEADIAPVVEQVVQVLREKTTRRGATKRFDVVAVGASQQAALEGLVAGDYTVLDGSTVKNVTVSYRTVQDVAVR